MARQMRRDEAQQITMQDEIRDLAIENIEDDEDLLRDDTEFLLNLPISITEDGNYFSLRNLKEERENNKIESRFREFNELSLDHQVELVVERLSNSEFFKLELMGSKLAEKDKAIQEVQDRTPTGQVLIDLERYSIENQIRNL